MSQEEIGAIIKAKNERERSEWEKVRITAFYSFIAQQGTKYVKIPQDLFHLPWDKEDKTTSKANRLTREEFLENAQKILDQ